VKGIFCEKPIAPTLREADAMIDACAAYGVRLSINHTRRGEPYYRRARQLVEEGAIGKVLTITTTWWGRLFLSGSHLFDLVNYFVDDVATAWLIGHTEEPTAQMPVMPTLRGQDVGGTAYVVYQNGVRAFFNGRDGNAAFRTDIFGSKGLIALDSYEAHLWQEDEASPHRELVQRPFPQRMYFTAPMVYLLEDLVGAIEQGGNTVSSGEAARHALAQIVATHFSSQHGNQKVIFPFDQLDMSAPFRW
jgi:predicted dehydrogenase